MKDEERRRYAGAGHFGLAARHRKPKLRLFMKPTVLWSLLLALAGMAPATTALERYEFSRPEMGMTFRITLYAPDEKTAGEAASAAFRRIKEINAIMSDYEPDSELSRLSRTSGSGQAVPLSDRLWFVWKKI